MKTLALLIALTLSSCASKKSVYKVHECPTWANSIQNPDNAEFVEEIAFNNHCDIDQVTQEQFDQRYITPYITKVK